MTHSVRLTTVGMALTALSAGCMGPSAGGTMRDLFGTAPPPGVKVVHFQADTIGMDPSFAWELAPIDETFLKGLVKKAGLKSPAAGQRPASTNYHWPKWWETERIEALPEVYSDDTSNLRRVWVDREHDRLFVEFVGL